MLAPSWAPRLHLRPSLFHSLLLFTSSSISYHGYSSYWLSVSPIFFLSSGWYWLRRHIYIIILSHSGHSHFSTLHHHRVPRRLPFTLPASSSFFTYKQYSIIVVVGCVLCVHAMVTTFFAYLFSSGWFHALWHPWFTTGHRGYSSYWFLVIGPIFSFSLPSLVGSGSRRYIYINFSSHPRRFISPFYIFVFLVVCHYFTCLTSYLHLQSLLSHHGLWLFIVSIHLCSGLLFSFFPLLRRSAP